MDGQEIVVRAEDEYKTILGSYPSYCPRSGLVFSVDAALEADVRVVVDIILKEVGTILGRKTTVKGKNVVEYSGQTSLDSRQMMATITIALMQEAGMIPVQSRKVSALRAFLAKFEAKKESISDTALITGVDFALTSLS
jgi:hypothetical protein